MPNEYDDLIKSNQSDQLNASMAVGIKAQPDTEAQLQKLADRTGVPLEAVRLKRPELEAQEKLANFDYEKVIKESPKLSAWLSDPANAALAHDDWENMSLLEQTLTRGADLPRALVGGAVRDAVGSTLMGAAGLIEAGARGLDAPFRAALDASPFETLVTAGGANLNPIQSMKHTGRLIKEAGDWIAPPKERQNFATDVAGGVGQLGGQIAMYLLTGGAATTTMMYAQGADVMQSKIAKDVADQSLKDTAVIAGGAITAITERYGLDKILNRVPPQIKNRTLRFIADKVAAGGIEAAQEATEGLLHDLTRKVLVNENAEIWEGVGNEASVAAVSAAIVRTALGVRGHRQSVAQEQLLKDLTTQVDQTKLKERYPEKLQQYIKSITKDGPLENIFVPAEQFNTYFQSAQIDPAVMASTLGVQNFHEALATGGDVVIPTASFMSQLSGTDHLQGLWEDLRLTQDAMTSRERKIAEMNRVPMQQEFAEAMAGEGDTTSADFQKAYDAIYGELAGRYDDNMAHQYATAHASAFSTLARRNGVPIEEFIAANTPKVVNGAMQDLRAVGDDVDIDLDPILDRLRAGDLPSEALAFGNSLYEFVRDAGGLEAVGEVRDLDESISRLPGQRKLAQEAGLALDMALEAAAEAGYFPGRDLSELTPADLLDALAEDIGGNRIYSSQNENDKSAHELRMLREMESWLSENNIDLASMTNAEIRAKLAEVEQGGAEYDQAAPQTESAAFKNWFGDSKVVDADGKPLVVYHGTSANFETFADPVDGDVYGKNFGRTDHWIYFTPDANSAGIYAVNADRMARHSPIDPSDANANVMPVFVRIENPLVIQADGSLGDSGIAQMDLTRDVVHQQYMDGMHDGVIVKDINGNIEAVATEFPSAIKSATGNNGSFDPANPSILYQSADASDRLIVAHNLSAENVLHAADLGGLPVPSLGISKAASPLTGYGEITLIGGADMAKPSAKNPAFDADVYSPRFPEIKVKVNEAQVSKVLDPLKNVAEAKGQRMRDSWYVMEDMRRNKLSTAISSISYDNGARLGFASVVLGKDLAVPMKSEQVAASGTGGLMSDARFAIKVGSVDLDTIQPGTAESRSLARALTNAQIRQVAALMGDKVATNEGHAKYVNAVNFRLKNYGSDRTFDSDGIGALNDLSQGGIERIKMLAKASSATPETRETVDFDALRNMLDREVPREQFDAWLHEQLSPLMGERRIVKDNGKTAEYTMDNIVREMTRKVRDAEGFNYGLGNARSKLATKFKKLADIQKQRDRVVGDAEFEAARKEIDAEFSALVDLVEAHKTYERESTSELLAEAVGDAFAKGVPKALEDTGFKGVPEDVQKRIGEFAAALAGAPTQYFEIKPQRAVAFSEFKGAVVPQDVSDEVRAVLEGAGLQIKTYERSSTEARAQAVAELSSELDAGTGSVLFQSARLTKRGMIQIGAGKQRFKISLFSDADASTFIHESGHMYLEIMRDLAARADAPQQTKDDWQAIRAWMGLKDGEAIGVEQHEMFARANEAYLMEGNAPNPELRGVFQRFKAWLVRIYRDVSRLNVPIDNRIRGVFDRIYATDEQIAAASSELEMSTAWATAAEAGMSEAEFAAYRATVDEAVERGESQLRAQLLNEYERERKRWWSYEKSLVRKQVTAEVDSEPVYMAFKALTTGAMEDGTPIKLSRSSLVAKFGEPFVVGLPKSSSRIYTEDGGTDVDTAAEVLGFANGRELIDQIANMRPRKEVIDARVDAEMRATHGDTLVDGTIEEAADAAVHNSLREKMLKIELRAIRKKAAEVGRINRAVQSDQAQERAAGEQFVRDALPQTERTRTGADGQQVTYMAFDPEPMRRAAAGLVGQKQVRDLKPHSYLLAERKAAKAFAKAMKDGDYMTAAEQKQRELFNHYLYREALAKREVVDKQAKYLNKQGQEPARQRLGKAGADYLEQVDEILERYEFKTVPLNKIAKRESLMAFVNRMEAAGNAVEVPEDVLIESRAVNWQQMTVDELGAVHDAVRNITHLASLKNKLLIKNKRKDFDQVVAELVDAANASALRSTGDADQLNDRDRDRKTSRKWLSILRKVDANLNKVEQWVEWLDGGKWGGPWSDNFFALADEAQAKEYELHRMVTKALSDLREQMPKDWVQSLDEKVGFDLPVPRLQGEKVVSTNEASRYTMLSIALNMGNEQNMQRLRDGNKLTDEHFRKIQAAMTDADWRFVQGVWDSIELLWPDMAALSKRATGLEPVKVEPQSFEVRWQTYRGGYFPIVYDQKRSEQGEKQADSDATVQAFLSSFVGRPTTNKGATKTRMEKVNAPLRLSFDEVIGSHVAKVVKDISHREAIAGMHKLLTDGRIRDVLIDKLGDARYAQMKNFVKALVVDRVDSLGAVEGIPAVMMKARTNLSIVTMGWKMRTAASQFAGFGPSKQFVSAGYLASAATTMWKFGADSRNEAMSLMMEKSTEMRNRAETRDRDVRDALRRLSDKKSIVADVQRSAFYLTALADRQVAGATWYGAYNEQLANGKTEEAAIAYADHAVRMSQGAGGAKDLSAIQRGHEFTKLFTMFYTPFAVLYANMTDMGYHFRKDGIAYLPKAVARAAWIVMVPAILGELLTFSGPDEDEDEVWWAVRKMLLYPVSALPIIRDVSGLLESRMIELSGDGKMEYQPSYSGSPIFPAIGKAWNNLVKKPTDVMAGNRDLDDDMAWDAFESAGLVFGLPTAQVRITGSYLLDLLTGDVEPEGATEIIRDGLFNKRKKE